VELVRTQPTKKCYIAKKLFEIEGVERVFLGSNFISVNKDPEYFWRQLRERVTNTIWEYDSTGKPFIEFEEALTPAEAEGDEVVAMIKEVLEERVRPAVQEDGGDIEFKGFKDGIVLLKMQGSCSGCSSSSVTLKSGIERMLMHYVPEVTGVIAVAEDDMEKINLEQFQKVEEKLGPEAPTIVAKYHESP